MLVGILGRARILERRLSELVAEGAPRSEAALAEAFALSDTCSRPPPISPRTFDEARATLAKLEATVADLQERRTNRRVRLETEVSLDGPNNFFVANAHDLGSGGLFVACAEPSPVGTEFDLTFTLPDGRRIECRGCVRWIRAADDPAGPQGMGVEFVHLLPADRQAIVGFMWQRTPIVPAPDDR